MKKLLITGSTFPRWDGDTEPRFILDYAKAMGKYYDVTVLVPAAVGAKSEEKMEGVHVIRYNYFPIHRLQTLCYPGAIVPRIKEKKIRILLVPFLLFSLFMQLSKMVKKYDVVHAHWLIPQGIVQSFVKGVPYIVTGHGGDVTSMNASLFKKMKIRCLKKAKKITVVSNALEEIIEEMYPNNKTSILSMGCNTDIFNPAKRIENYFEQGDKKVVLFVGRLAEVKGVEYLIEAMKAVEDAILVIVGKGNLEEELHEKAAGMEDKVRFLGARDHGELPTIYASADIFVAPSITASDGGKEGFGLVMIEAMASGLPVISSRSGGIVDIIKSGENGLLTEERDFGKIAEYINLLIQDKMLYEKLSEAAKKTAQKYDYQNIALQYQKLLEDIE